MKTYPHMLGFAIVIAGLLIPFVLREINPRYEPYPAVLLPSGAYLARITDGKYQYQFRQLSAYDPRGRRWVDLDEADFLAPVPTTTVQPILSRLAGNFTAPLDTAGELARSLRASLTARGFAVDSLRNERVAISVAMATGEVTARDTISRVNVAL